MPKSPLASLEKWFTDCGLAKHWPTIKSMLPQTLTLVDNHYRDARKVPVAFGYGDAPIYRVSNRFMVGFYELPNIRVAYMASILQAFGCSSMIFMIETLWQRESNGDTSSLPEIRHR